MKNKVIRFGDGLPTLLDYGKRSWNLNEKYIIEFYPNFTTSVLLISAENSLLQTHLDEISNNTEPISLDLEWEEEICLFQFCTSKGCLIIRHLRGPGNSVLRSFLENHSFYGKGNYNDLQKLTEKFGDDFKIDLEDIERTRLIPNGYSTNFIKMSEQFAGKSTAVFKDKEMTFSNWESETLSMRQVMYAAFDVVALFKCYSNFPPCTENLKPIKIKKKGPKGKKCINIDSAFRRKYPIVSPNKIDISKPLFCYILKNYTENPNIYEIKNKICKLSNNINEEEENDLFDDDYLVDYISVFKNDDNSIDILVSLFVEINKNNLNSEFLSCEKVIIVPEIDQFTVELLTKDDVFYLNEIQENLLNYNSLNDFLSIFGTDFSFILFENYKYASVKPNDPYAALRLIKFLPFVSKIQLHEFPSFLPVLSVYSQSNSDIKNQINLTEEQQQRIEIKNVQNNKYIFTFSSNDEKEQFLENFIKNNTFENQLMIFPFTSDELINIMQSYKIILKNCQLSIPSIYDKFNKIGQLFSIHKNEILNIIYIQFRAKSDAYRALIHMTELSNNIEILKGTKVTLRNLPENITEREIIDSCKNAYEILELNLNDKKFMKLIFKNQLQAEEFCEELKAKEIRGKQIQAELVYPQKEETPYWKMQQINKWVKIKINKDMNEIFMKANEFGKIIDIKMKDEFIYIMFNNEESAEEMKKANNEFEDIDQQIFTLFLNKKLLMNEIKDNNPNEPSYVNRKVFILDPKPDLLTDELLAEKAFNWRHLISGAHNIDSIAHAGKKRTIFYSGGKKRDQQIINLIINLGVELGDENKWKPVTMTFSKATKLLSVPPPPIKKPRRWVIIDPAPKSMTEDVIRNICTGEEPFDVMFQNSSIQKGEKRAVILKEPHARNIFWKIKEMEYDGIKLNVTKIPPENAPPPLE